MLRRNKKHAHPQQDVNINGRRLTFSIKTGLKKLTQRLRHPAAKFAHLALAGEKPMDSKIDTE